MKKSVERCLNELVVSCQAYKDTPFYGPVTIQKFLQGAMMGGAKAVRCCWPQDIKAARKLSEDLIIIGIYKSVESDEGDKDDIFITPNFETAKEIIEAGSDIIGLDTRITKKRGREELLNLLRKIHQEYPDVGIMADCSTFEDCMISANSGYVDIIGTTLSGMNKQLNGPDVELVKKLKANIDLPVNAEGNVWELRDIDNLKEAGADMITIGSAITRPQVIAKRFIDHYKGNDQ